MSYKDILFFGIKNKVYISIQNYKIVLAEEFQNNIEQIAVQGISLLLGKIFDEIEIQYLTAYFKLLVLDHICFSARRSNNRYTF